MFSIPAMPMPDGKEVEAHLKKMSEEMSAFMPKPYAGAANLIVHPVAAMAAGSAVGVGLAAQAFGIWMGAVSGAMEASARLMALGPIGKEDIESFRSPREARRRASAAVETIAADAEIVARHVVEVATETVEAIAEDAGKAATAAAAAAEKLLKPASIERPEKPDDLKAISGIGPKLEMVLNDLGIWTYEQIAQWNESQVAWIDDYLSFPGRIARDRWIEQAAELAKANK